jgi:hypothetical protein
VQIPIGAVVDTRRGRAQLTLATDARGHLQKGTFKGGVFQVVQRRSAALTELRLGGGIFDSCTPGGGGASRRLEATVHGSFRTRGRYSTATAGGTTWLTKDTCSGTLTVVSSGSVEVRDSTRRTTVPVTSGHSYVARPR